MTLRRDARVGVGFIVAVALLGCAAPQPPPADTRAADEATIRKADEDWATAAQTRQVAAWVELYADDAVVLPPNDTMATSKAGISKAVGDLLTLPSLTIGWQPVKIEVARSGDIAYARGTYELAYNDPKGKRITDRGKYLEIWKKQPAGRWKCIVDTWNSDLPP
jgi:ketosteroid isomerase-like protein